MREVTRSFAVFRRFPVSRFLFALARFDAASVCKSSVSAACSRGLVT